MRNNIHPEATNKDIKKVRSMSVDDWEFKYLKGMEMSFNTVSGGRVKIPASSNEQLLIITRGLGSVTETNQVVETGTVIELPPGQSINLHGQFKFYLVSTK